MTINRARLRAQLDASPVKQQRQVSSQRETRVAYMFVDLLEKAASDKYGSSSDRIDAFTSALQLMDSLPSCLHLSSLDVDMGVEFLRAMKRIIVCDTARGIHEIFYGGLMTTEVDGINSSFRLYCRKVFSHVAIAHGLYMFNSCEKILNDHYPS